MIDHGQLPGSAVDFSICATAPSPPVETPRDKLPKACLLKKERPWPISFLHLHPSLSLARAPVKIKRKFYKQEIEQSHLMEYFIFCTNKSPFQLFENFNPCQWVSLLFFRFQFPLQFPNVAPRTSPALIFFTKIKHPSSYIIILTLANLFNITPSNEIIKSN